VTGDWVKPGAAVVDVGINAVDDKSSKKGYRLVSERERLGGRNQGKGTCRREGRSFVPKQDVGHVQPPMPNLVS
jgi:hypothetical protein